MFTDLGVVHKRRGMQTGGSGECFSSEGIGFRQGVVKFVLFGSGPGFPGGMDRRNLYGVTQTNPESKAERVCDVLVKIVAQRLAPRYSPNQFIQEEPIRSRVVPVRRA